MGPTTKRWSCFTINNWHIKAIHGWYEPSLPALSLIKRDLEYVSNEWNMPGYDLWEEIYGMHFYTLMVQQASLYTGQQVAKKYNDIGAALFYETKKKEIQEYLERFWDSGRERVVATIGSDRLDVSLILACLHTRNNDMSFSVYKCSSNRIMVSAAKLHGLFQQEYSINHDTDIPLLGRYANDKYNGVDLGLGNPWILATFSFAEMIYQIAVEFLEKKSIVIDRTSLLFYHNVLRLSVKSGVLHDSNCDFHYIISNLTYQGDRYMERVVGITTEFSEQLHRDIAVPQGARDLTWSYSSFVTAFNTRTRLNNMWLSMDCL
jgi:glucoamylase